MRSFLFFASVFSYILLHYSSFESPHRYQKVEKFRSIQYLQFAPPALHLPPRQSIPPTHPQTQSMLLNFTRPRKTIPAILTLLCPVRNRDAVVPITVSGTTAAVCAITFCLYRPKGFFVLASPSFAFFLLFICFAFYLCARRKGFEEKGRGGKPKGKKRKERELERTREKAYQLCLEFIFATRFPWQTS